MPPSITQTTSNLQTIQQKVRMLTRSPDENSLTTAQLNQYINTAVLYDFPSHLRLFSLRQTLTFYTQPNVDTYTTSTDPNDPLYNFANLYIAVHPPVYGAGIPLFFTQYRQPFYAYWPQTNSVGGIGIQGDGTPGPYTFILNAVPVLQNNVVFTVVDVNGAGMTIIDYPSTNTVGFLDIPNSSPDALSNMGLINYVNGAVTGLTFPNNTQDGATIYSETIPYQPGKPVSVLYFNNTFTIRPVPDNVYPIQVEVDVIPTELLNTDQNPNINQWWQYIAYLAAKKVFEDRMDLNSVQLIMPELMKQENLVNRTSIVQKANERTVTIYTQGKMYNGPWWFPTSWPY